MRKSRLYQITQVEQSPGLSEYLTGYATIDEVIKNFDTNLSIITSGRIPLNPAELLESNEMTELLDKLKSMFDIIIIDTPPMTVVTDASILVNHTDALAIVVRIKKTKKNILKDLLKYIHNKQIKNAVLIINDIPRQRIWLWIRLWIWRIWVWIC